MARLWATRTIEPETLERFAVYAGDFNPLHVDPVFARRSITGAQTAHGMLLVHLGLELFAEQYTDVCLTSMRGEFLKPVFAGETVEWTIESDDSTLTVNAFVGARHVLKATAQYSAADSRPKTIPALTPVSSQEPRAHSEQALIDGGISGSVPYGADVTPFAELFPALARSPLASQAVALAALSRIVGMECPGMNSLFWSFDASFDAAQALPATVDWALTGFRKAYRLCSLKAQAVSLMQATFQAFATRPAPPALTLEQASAALPNDIRFDGRRALIIGGSRGLGDALVKLLATHGAHIAFTYHRGEAESQAILEMLTRAGIVAHAIRCDVTKQDEVRTCVEQTTKALGGLDIVIYAATPPIRAIGFEQLGVADLENMLATNVRGLFFIAQAALPHLHVRKGLLVNISSEYVENPVPDMAHYIAAKSAGEGLLRALAEEQGEAIGVCNLRLRRFESDQTRHAMLKEKLPSALETAASVCRAIAENRRGYVEALLP